MILRISRRIFNLSAHTILEFILIINYICDKLWNKSYMRTADMKSNEEWSLQLWTHFRSFHVWFISCTFVKLISFTGMYEHIIDRLPTSLASELSWLEHRTGITRSWVQNPVEVLNSFQASCLSNWRVHAITCTLKWLFFHCSQKKYLEFLVFWF